MSGPVRVVIADDHPMFRYGVVAALGTSDQVTVVGEAATGRELLAAVAARQPDVVLTDLAMPDLDGASATRALVERRPGIGVVVLTMHADDESVLAVAAGHAVYGAAVAARIAELSTVGSRRDAFPELTQRERAVLELLASGARNGQIASALGITDKTVRNHISAILWKLQVSDRTAAALKARDRGITPGAGYAR